MKLISRVALVTVTALFLVGSLWAQEMTKEEWQKQITELTAKVSDLKTKAAALTKDIADLKAQDAAKEAELKKCMEEKMALVGADEAAQKTYEGELARIESSVSDLSRLSDQDLWARKAEVDKAQADLDALKKNQLSLLPMYADRINALQSRIDALKATLKKLAEAGMGGMIYTVGTWAKDRDCLWNIAKKPKIYNNAFLWPKIWQGNRDQIKNPDIIHPGQKLKIPPKAPLTNEEKAAERSYWRNK